MYVGVRAGGGIGDEIEDPAGDEYELYRVVFDITFFFFVIVILLAIIQGTDDAEPVFSQAAADCFNFLTFDVCYSTSCYDVAVGLIIDAFGELRDQQEQVKEDMEVRVSHSPMRLAVSFVQHDFVYVSVHRQNVSYVALEVTTLIRLRTASRPTLWMNTTWPTTCERATRVICCLFVFCM